jgi:ubiquinone/menaquinone biosynthesis C-methylase UbiE
MNERQNTIWERFLSPVIDLLMDGEELNSQVLSIDWEKAGDRFRRDDVAIPIYYANQTMHGMTGGYLNPRVVVAYDAITQYTLPPHETWVRQALIDGIQVKPRRILDLGCGTGSTTLMLKQAFPQAEVIGVDLSPYMLVKAENKASSAGLDISWRHGNVEKLGFRDGSFDLVTAALLFHELPMTVSQAVLRESYRLLTVGGQILILDSNQQALRQLDWLKDVFEQPYLREYAAGSMNTSINTAGFAAVETQDVWWLHQVTRGVKPISGEKIRQYTQPTVDNNDLEDFGSPVFGIVV